ncbi:hypothetical protein NMY22_g7811 [Coprinellus aureogranulatus]|nr:hypothetical protein NMY22_g7811 [Coprinellus aureogranulatus]
MYAYVHSVSNGGENIGSAPGYLSVSPTSWFNLIPPWFSRNERRTPSRNYPFLQRPLRISSALRQALHAAVLAAGASLIAMPRLGRESPTLGPVRCCSQGRRGHKTCLDLHRGRVCPERCVSDERMTRHTLSKETVFGNDMPSSLGLSLHRTSSFWAAHQSHQHHFRDVTVGLTMGIAGLWPASGRHGLTLRY